MTQRLFEYVSLILLCLSSVLLFSTNFTLISNISLVIGVVVTLLCRKEFYKYILLLYGAVTLVGYSPVSTDLSITHMFFLLFCVTVAAGVPYLVSKFLYKSDVINFPLIPKKRWSKRRYGYIIFSVVASYILLFFYFNTTGSYVNWQVQADSFSLFKLFLGTFLLGLWDELFFICTCFGVIKRFFPLKVANIAQAIIFSSFLYWVGFKSWGYGLTFAFALLQGSVYNKTNALLFLIVIHWIVDLALYFLLLHMNGII